MTNRMRSLDATRVYDQDEKEIIQKFGFSDKVMEFVTVYAPELLLLYLIVFNLSNYINNKIGVIIIILATVVLYILLKPIYMRALKRMVLLETAKSFKYTFFDEELDEIVCMDDDKFNPTKIDGIFYKIERIP